MPNPHRGGTANYLRFGPYCVLVFLFVEQGRKLERALLQRGGLTVGD